jgi:hypothetical protein
LSYNFGTIRRASSRVSNLDALIGSKTLWPDDLKACYGSKRLEIATKRNTFAVLS